MTLPFNHTPPEGSALLLVDPLNDFTHSYGALYVKDAGDLIPEWNRQLGNFARARRPIYVTQEGHTPDSIHFKDNGGPWDYHGLEGTWGNLIYSDVRLPQSTNIIVKARDPQSHGYSATEGGDFLGRSLVHNLRQLGVTDVYVMGLATDYCIKQSVLDLLKAGFRVHVLLAGIKAVNPENTAAALAEMRAAGAELV